MKDEVVVIEQWVWHVDELIKRYDWDDLSVMQLIATRLWPQEVMWHQYHHHLRADESTAGGPVLEDGAI